MTFPVVETPIERFCAPFVFVGGLMLCGLLLMYSVVVALARGIARWGVGQ